MPGSLWSDFRQGNRTEYLAQYFLTALGVSTPVPRQEDIGIDFYCALEQNKGGRLTFHSPFTVQVGSKGSKKFRYGGVKNNRWQREEIDWLFSQDLPLLLCLVDKDAHEFELFSTSPIWGQLYLFGAVGEVILLPGKGDSLPKPPTHDDALRKAGAATTLRMAIPLGDPVVSLRLTDVTNDDLLGKVHEALKFAIDLDAQNILYRKLNVHFSTCLLAEKIIPNGDNREGLGINFAWNAQKGRNTTEQLKSIAPIVIALAQNLLAQHRNEALEKLKGILSLLQGERDRLGIPLPLLDQIFEKLGLPPL